jgi:alkylation response protein AidB-like acyl-CoA dehydrogenase
MNFQHTEDRRMLADSLDRFVREQYGFETRQRIAGSAEGCSRDMWRRFAELGVFAALFDEAHGGMGGTGFDIMVVFEAFGRGLVVEPVAGALMAGQVLARCESEAARALLEQLIAGEKIVVLAYEEGDTGADPTCIAGRAEAAGDGWTLSGTKSVVHQAEAADAFVVAARTAGAPGRTEGISLFLVPAGTPGLKLRGYALVDGGRGAELMLDDVRLDANALLGAVNEGYALLRSAVGCGLLALVAESLGAMDAAKAATLDYLRPASSSACRSAASRHCNTAWPTCCLKSNRRARR